MDSTTFEARLNIAARRAVELARCMVWQSLAEELAFLVYPNQSYDGHQRVADEDVFPTDSLPDGAWLGPWSIGQAVDFLWRDGKVPEWVDVAVESVNGSSTNISLRCCGRFTANEQLLYYPSSDVSPLSVKSPPLPPGWESVEKSGRFDFYWLHKRRFRPGFGFSRADAAVVRGPRRPWWKRLLGG